MRVFRVALLMLTSLMLSMACLPVFGLDLVLFGRVGLEAANVDDSNIHLFMVRSAAFATFAAASVGGSSLSALTHTDTVPS